MKRGWKKFVYAVLIAMCLTALAALGVLEYPDLAAGDALYQSRSTPDGEIVLVEIDQRALEEIGAYDQWGRDVMAMVLDTLNESEECHPAAIALDILYTSERDADTDEWLAEAAGRYGNVVTAGAAKFGTAMTEEENGEYGMDTFSVLEFEEPYAALEKVTSCGHINVMLDEADGILRHHLLSLNLPDGTTIPSLALAAAQLYWEYWEIEPPKLPETDAHGFWYLPYCGQPGDFDEAISVASILSGEVTADYFAGKIVLIGPYAPGFQDSYIPSIDHARQMYGVEVHANAIQALLRGEHRAEAGDGWQLLCLFVILFAAFFGFWKRRMRVSTILWAVLAGGWLGLCLALSRAGLLLHVLWVPTGVTILYIGCIAFNYIASVLEKQKISNTFKRYVDPSVIQELMRAGSDSLELGGRLTDIAVLFVDIRGFTTMSEVLTPPQVVEILNQYLTLTTRCVMDNHGTLDKFVGDCTMAIWNAPLKQEDYVMNACKAAMDMVSGSKPLAEKLQKEFGRTVSFGVGVNAGPAVVGNIGAPIRMDYTAIGDTVNTAARLEANAPGGTVYISRAVADALKGRIRVTSLGDTIKLKGKKEGFEILRLEEILD